jgi:hypothetical protein
LSTSQARDEQVIKLGLRTLEFWVDNLNPEYLYPHMWWVTAACCPPCFRAAD